MHVFLKFTLLHLIVGLYIIGCAQPSLNKSLHFNSSAFEEMLTDFIGDEMKEHQIPGVAFAFVKDGKIEVLKGFGHMDIKSKRPIDPQTSIFRIGSISKLCTIMALMRLEDQGLLDLDMPVNIYFEKPLFEEKFEQPVLVKHLLNHTGGFDQTGFSRQVFRASDRPSLEDFLRNNLVPIRKPGEASVYDTYGTTLAGLLIEKISGLPYKTYMEQHFFSSIEMTNSFVEVPKDKKQNLVTGYGLSEGKLIPQAYEWYITLPASSIDATTLDMAKLITALLANGKYKQGSLFGKETGKRIKMPQVDFREGVDAFAYGFWEGSAHGHRSIEHGGVMWGYETKLVLIPDFNIGFFIALNRDPEKGPPTNLGNNTQKLIIDYLFPEDLRPTISEPRLAMDTKKFEGNYVSNLGCYSCPAGSGWGINNNPITSLGPGEIALWGEAWVAIDSTTFQHKEGKTRLGFVLEKNGAIKYMVYRSNSYTKINDHTLTDLLGEGWENRQKTRLQSLLEKEEIINLPSNRNLNDDNPLNFKLVETTELYKERASTGGISWIDFDNDGDDDAFVTNGYDVSKSPAIPQTNWLYENKNGKLYKANSNISEIEGLSSGSAWADMDNDGYIDVFVPNQRNQDNFLFKNLGNGKFDYLQTALPSNGGGVSFASSWGDIDNDGYVDLFVFNGGLTGRGKDFMFRNIDGENFKALTNVITKDTLQSGGGTLVDYDLDGDLDLYVGGYPIRMYKNNGKGDFVIDTQAAFVREPYLGGISMGGAWGDFDNDGDFDLFQTFNRQERNHLYLNQGDGEFKRVFVGDATQEISSAFHALWVDLDNDSFLDLVVANWGSPPFVYKNNAGKSLDRVSIESFESRNWFASMVAASDYDGDGDVDLVVGNWPAQPGDGEANLLFRNESPVGNFVQLKLVGTNSNCSAIGARIEILVEQDREERKIMRDIRSQDGWRSQSSLACLIGLGTATNIKSAKVFWPSGHVQDLDLKANGRYTIIEDD